MLFQLLAEKFPSLAQIARALGITRQAYCQAVKRGFLSPSAILRAAELLCIDAGPLLIQRAQLTPRQPCDSAPPVQPPSPDFPADAEKCHCHSLYYVKPEPHQTNDEAPCKKIPACQHDGSNEQKNSRPYYGCIKTMTHVNYLPSYEKNRDAIDLIRWVLAVAKLPADSPRFAYYVSRWRVPEKISAAKNDGSFDEAVKNCPPYDPSWVRFVPAAITEYLQFIGDHRASCPQPWLEVKFA